MDIRKTKNTKKSVIAAIITLLLILVCASLCVSVLAMSKNYSEIYNMPRNTGGTIDFTDFEIDSAAIDINLAGEFEFFYDRWIVENNDTAPPDAIVKVPHRLSETKIDGQPIDYRRISSYRMYIKGLPIGHTFHVVLNNFSGACRAYLNGQVVLEYGSRNTTGNATSNGAPSNTVSFTVADDTPIALVFEVSAHNESGLHTCPWLSLKSTDVLYWLSRNSGIFFLGILLMLLLISLVMNFASVKKDRIWTFSFFLVLNFLLFLFSSDVYWRICESTQNNLFNIVLNVNFAISPLYLLALFAHFVKHSGARYPTWQIAATLVTFVACTLSIFLVQDSILRIIPVYIMAFCALLWGYPIAKTILAGNRYNILYLVILSFCSFFLLTSLVDLMDVIVFGLDLIASSFLYGAAITTILMYWLLEVDKRKKLIYATQLEKDHIKVRASALRAQIKPHFIFNSLTNIQHLYNQSVSDGNTALTKFSKHLRANIEAEGRDLIPFLEELENILNYADLENMRRLPEEQINLMLDCEEYNFDVPILSLQPFLENAFKYSGVEGKEDGYVEIKSYYENGKYVVEVNDNGKGFLTSSIKPTSTGLRNAQERLQLICNANITIDSVLGSGTRIKIIFEEEKL